LWLSSVTEVVAPLPEQSPDQPAKVEPAAGVAVSVATVPLGKLALHVAPQSMPAGLDATEPAPAFGRRAPQGLQPLWSGGADAPLEERAAGVTILRSRGTQAA
jgi:hypothetical protein